MLVLDGVQLTALLLTAVSCVHLARALSVRPSSARRWSATRGLATEPRLLGLVEAHLRRLHWGRLAGTGLLGSVSLVLAWQSRPTISFLSLPLLVGVLLAELLVPGPRRGRVRTVVLQPRTTSYFAPRRALLVTRVLLLLGTALGVGGLLGDGRQREMLLGHVLVLLCGWAVLELALRRLTWRGLPDRHEDLALACAIRVSDARGLAAAGLVFSALGALVSATPLLPEPGGVGSGVLSALVPAAVLAVLGWAIALTQPLSSWRPA